MSITANTASAWRARLLLGVALAALAALAVAQPAAAKSRTVTWHQISLAKLLHPKALKPSEYTKTTDIGSTLFRYAWQGFVDDSADNFGSAPQIDTVLKRNNTTCRSITFSGGATQEDTSEPQVGPEIDVFREGLTEARQELPLYSVATLTAIKLQPRHAFVVKVRTGYDGSEDEGNTVSINGSASCTTGSGGS
jgi:hypothetical protein